jgi:hypothetical protein
MVASDSLVGTLMTSYSGYIDSSNAPFGTGTLVGTAGPGGNATGPGPLSEPFSMTVQTAITMGANASYTLTSLNLMAAPLLPLTIACPSASGQESVGYDSHLVAGGGLPPYSYSTLGSLPAGLLLNAATGELSGTPGVSGTFSFTAQVKDSSGAPMATTPCSIVVSAPPAPLALACPDPNDEENIYYSSSLVATGGKPPYSFSLSRGSLPPGLSLNPTTGAITGIDSTAVGNYPFTALVIDSSGAANGANQVLANCLLVAAVPNLRLAAVRGTTPQTVTVNTVLRTPLAVVVTDAKTGLPVQGITVTFTVRILQGTPGGTFAGGANNDINTLNSVDARSDANGVATAPAYTANTMVGGPYNVTARANNATANTISFQITNVPGPAFFIVPVPNPYPGQTTGAGTNFANALSARVTDQFGNTVPNWPVTFSAPPAPAAGAVFTAAKTPTTTVNTNAQGVATTAVAANPRVGTYTVTAVIVQVAPPILALPALFPNMRNTVGSPAKIVQVVAQGDPTVSGAGVHYATTNARFSTLTVRVTDANDNPITGRQVQFQSTNRQGDPGATFAGPNTTVNIICRLNTDQNGYASADALTANGTVGAFDVVVTVPGTGLRTTFNMRNTGSVAVPNVVGMTRAAATTAINGARLVVGNVTMQASARVPAGSIISTNPVAATAVNIGSSVDLVISTGK